MHMAIKELRKTVKENKRLCIENHRDLSVKLLHANVASTSYSKPEASKKEENWTYIAKSGPEKKDSDDESEEERPGLSCHYVNQDVMYCVKLKVQVGNHTEFWKVLMDTGSRLNIVSDKVVPARLGRPTACPKVITASGAIPTKHEAEVNIFLTESTEFVLFVQ